MHFTLGNIFVRYAVNGEADEARRGETVSLLASLTKAKHRPSLYTSVGNFDSPRLMAISATSDNKG